MKLLVEKDGLCRDEKLRVGICFDEGWTEV